uniref:Myb-like domain-containing protein n=1 Tax=Globodera pallida TaxID=36090 RepID=A0A183C8W2_GLOPA
MSSVCAAAAASLYCSASVASSPTTIATAAARSSSTTAVGKRRHHHTNCCCWTAFDVHANVVQYVTVFEDDFVLRGSAVEPKVFTKSILASIKSFNTFRQKRSEWRIADLAAIFGYVCAHIDQQFAGENGCLPPRIPTKAVIVVPTRCSLPYQLAVEEAAEAAGFTEAHLICRATALAISYRMMFLDEDDAQFVKLIDDLGTENERRREQAAAALMKREDELIVQLDDNNDDDGDQQSADINGWLDKFVAILYACEHCIELIIFDFQPHHLPTLISSKVLFVDNLHSQNDLINKFFCKHLTPLHDNLFKLLTAGEPKLIGLLSTNIKKHIASSCQIVAKSAIRPDTATIFGASLKAVHLMLGKELADRSPLFLNRSMVPDFDYLVDDDEANVDAVVDDQAKQKMEEIEAIDESFNKAFGLIEQKSPKLKLIKQYEEHEEEEEEAEEKARSFAYENDDPKHIDRKDTTANDAESEDEAFLAGILEGKQCPGAKKQLTDDEVQVLSDVIKFDLTFDAMPKAECQITTPESAALNVMTLQQLQVYCLLLALLALRRVVVMQAFQGNFCRRRLNTRLQAIHGFLPVQHATTLQACHVAFRNRHDITLLLMLQQQQQVILRKRQGTPQLALGHVLARRLHVVTSLQVHANHLNVFLKHRFNLERRCSMDKFDGNECSDVPSSAKFSTENVDSLEAGNKMKWEETDDDETEGEADEIATLGDDRSEIVGEPDIPSSTSSPREAVEESADDSEAAGVDSGGGGATPVPVLNTNYGRAQRHGRFAGDGQQKTAGAEWHLKWWKTKTARSSSRATPTLVTSDDEASTAATTAGTGAGGFSTIEGRRGAVPNVARRGADDGDLFGPERPLAGKFSEDIERQFYLQLPVCGEGPISSVQVVGLPLQWIGNKFFQQEFKEWLRIRSGLRTNALINCFVSFSVTASTAFRVCRYGRYSICPYNGAHNGLIVYALLPTPEVAWHVCWACNQFEDDLINYWPNKYAPLKFKPTVTQANRQTFLEETYA